MARGGTAWAPALVPAVWGFPDAVGELTWETPDGAMGTKDIIFGTVLDPDASVVAEWWHRPSWDEVLFGGAQHGPQMGPCVEGGRLRHVASGNVFFVAQSIWPHLPRLVPSTDAAWNGLFRLMPLFSGTELSTLTHLANDDWDCVGRKDWEQTILPAVSSGALELL